MGSVRLRAHRPLEKDTLIPMEALWNYYGHPMEILWNSMGTLPEPHPGNRLATAVAAPAGIGLSGEAAGLW
jgi:hypothetical protein